MKYEYVEIGNGISVHTTEMMTWKEYFRVSSAPSGDCHNGKWQWVNWISPEVNSASFFEGYLKEAVLKAVSLGGRVKDLQRI